MQRTDQPPTQPAHTRTTHTRTTHARTVTHRTPTTRTTRIHRTTIIRPAPMTSIVPLPGVHGSCENSCEAPHNEGYEPTDDDGGGGAVENR